MSTNPSSLPSSAASGTASAPGKLILFGEHAVVHHQPAICASLSELRIYVTAQEAFDGRIQVEMPDLQCPSLKCFRAMTTSVCLPSSDSSELKGQGSDNEQIHVDEINQILKHTGLSDAFSLQALAPVIHLVNKLVPMLLTNER